MKLVIFSYWKNRWVYYMQDYFKPLGDEVKYSAVVDIPLLKWADTALIAWCNEMAIQISNYPIKFCKQIVYVRGYELFSGFMKQINWQAIDGAIFTNAENIPLAKREGMKLADEHMHWIPNGIDTNFWVFQPEHVKGNKLAFVANINHKKGVPLLLQIFAKLQDSYELHLAGQIQELRFWNYFNWLAVEMGVNKRIYYAGFISTGEKLQEWLKDKSYILSTSPTEGHPNCLLESMSLGLKPIIHNWQGAKTQFPSKFIFNTVDEAVKLITEDDYDANEYRKFIEDNYDFKKVYPKLEGILT